MPSGYRVGIPQPIHRIGAHVRTLYMYVYNHIACLPNRSVSCWQFPSECPYQKQCAIIHHDHVTTPPGPCSSMLFVAKSLRGRLFMKKFNPLANTLGDVVCC